jgi:hypothetical protein
MDKGLAVLFGALISIIAILLIGLISVIVIEVLC